MTPSRTFRFSARSLAWSLPSLLTLLLGAGCIAPGTAISQEQQRPPVAEQKEQQPGISILRGAIALPFIDREEMKKAYLAFTFDTRGSRII